MRITNRVFDYLIDEGPFRSSFSRPALPLFVRMRRGGVFYAEFCIAYDVKQFGFTSELADGDCEN
jgi:hypothetical protein